MKKSIVIIPLLLLQASISGFAADDISSYFAPPNSDTALYETGNANDRSRYLDYLISGYLLSQTGLVNNKLEAKAFWCMKCLEKSYRASQVAKNVEVLFDTAGELLNECEGELKNIKNSSSYSVDVKKSKIYPYLGEISSKWMPQYIKDSMQLYFDADDDRVPLANCKHWTGVYQDNRSKMVNGKGVKLLGVTPSCETFEQLKQCTGEFYQLAHTRYKADPANHTKPPTSKVMEYINTGKWPEKSINLPATTELPEHADSSHFSNLSWKILSKDLEDATYIFKAEHLYRPNPLDLSTKETHQLLAFEKPFMVKVLSTKDEKQVKDAMLSYPPLTTREGEIRPLIKAYLHALTPYYSEDINDIANFITNIDNIKKYQNGMSYEGSSTLHSSLIVNISEQDVATIETKLNRKLTDKEKIHLALITSPK